MHPIMIYLLKKQEKHAGTSIANSRENHGELATINGFFIPKIAIQCLCHRVAVKMPTMVPVALLFIALSLCVPGQGQSKAYVIAWAGQSKQQ